MNSDVLLRGMALRKLKQLIAAEEATPELERAQKELAATRLARDAFYNEKIAALIDLAVARREIQELRGEKMGKKGIYVASKTRHAAMWKMLRGAGKPIISTWIDEAGIGETKSFEDLWERCISEASNAERLVVYAEEGDELKGALVEVGAALGNNVPVLVVGNVPQLKTAMHHRLIQLCDSLHEAFDLPPATSACSELDATDGARKS